jgi:hypothetical protein
MRVKLQAIVLIFFHIGPFFYVWDVLPHIQSGVINVGSVYIGLVWTKIKIYFYAPIPEVM